MTRAFSAFANGGFPTPDHFAQYHVMLKLSPALSEIFASDNSEFGRLFSTYMSPPPKKDGNGRKKADVKKQRYDLAILVNDKPIEEKGRFVNTPVQFIGARDHTQYELVVNSVDKDRIRGYLSTPKDKVLAAERPQFRP